MIKRILATFAFFGLLVPATTFAQTGTVSGTVTEAETGQTLPGATVQVVDGDVGAATDSEGQYRLTNVAAGQQTIRVTFVGYNPVTRTVNVPEGGTVRANFQLESGSVGLDEVVVTGYGTEQTEGELTGSISNVSSDEIQDVPAQNTESLLQGRAAGVTVSSTSGNPGGGFEVEIRGEGSINAGGSPLYIVDGVQISDDQNRYISSRSPLNAINPNDIESIQVLKDAAAASIYGAQAANGVVLIETKSGQQGPVQVSLQFEGGVRFQSNRIDMTNRDEWMTLQNEAFGEGEVRNSIFPAFGYDQDTPVSEMRDFDWQDWLFEPGPHRSVGFTANGGDEETQFYLSGSWQKTGGAMVAEASNYTQYSIRTNVDQRLTENLDLGIKLNLSNEKQNGVCQDGYFINCPFYQSIGEEPPISYPYNDDGTYNPDTEQSPTYNPAVTLYEETRRITTTQFVGSLAPTYQITPWLSAQGSFGLDWQTNKEYDYGTPTVAPAEGGELSQGAADITNMTLNMTLQADQTFGGVHDVSGMVGTEYRRHFEEDVGQGVIGFNNSLLRVANAASQNWFVPSGFTQQFRQLSYFGRLNYTFDSRYIVRASSRLDGSSKFGADRRWGFFPSASVAWRISEESFFNVDAIDNLKMRVSYGTTGNSEIGEYAARTLYSIGSSYDSQPGIRPNQLANRQLTWEENQEINIGLDWGMWGGRFSGNLNVYRSNSNNLLLNRPLPNSSGYGSITENIGKVQNEGIELDINTVNIQTESFRWSTRFNISVTRNEVLELTPGVEQLGSGNVPVAVGHSLETWHVPEWAGVNPADGSPMFYDEDGNLTYRWDDADRKWIDGAEEDVVGGIGTRMNYKGLSLDVFFDYSYGAMLNPNAERSYTDPFGEGILGMIYDRRWTEPGQLAQYPKMVPDGNYNHLNADSPDGVNTLWLQKGNFIRLKSISLSYNVPERLAERVGLSGGRIYVSGLNLWFATPMLGHDPESSGVGETASYPTEQQVNVGLELDL